VGHVVGYAMTYDEYEAGRDADGERRLEMLLEDEHDRRVAATSEHEAEDWGHEDCSVCDEARADSIARLKAENERLRKWLEHIRDQTGDEADAGAFARDMAARALAIRRRTEGGRE
jgi:hypothetical protein